MATKGSFASVVKWLLMGGWLLLFIGGIAHYPGSYLAYAMFSMAFLAMLISGFYRQVSYGYLFLVVMLWLGFWFKLTIHLLLDYPFGEPIGFFAGTPPAWDEVLLVATIGSLGVLAARFLYSLTGAPSTMFARNNEFEAPVWYISVRKRMWAGAIFVCVGLAIINSSLGILQIGLVPSTILSWPLNAVISWLIGYGLTFCIATLLWWDIALGRKISLVIYFVLLEAFTSTVSVFSRGIYIFHTVPQFLAVYKNRYLISAWSWRNIIALAGVFVLLFTISNPLVNTLRAYYYSGVIPAGYFFGDRTEVETATGATGQIEILGKFAVDRWIGVEGVMAVSAFPKKGGDLFMRGLMERRKIGKFDIYQEICQSHYRFTDMQKFQFASLPGSMGLLYYSGYLWMVALGMIVLVLAMLGSEGLVFRLASNPLLSALWGGAAANAIVQLGVAPVGLLIYFFEMICGIVVIWVIQSEWFSDVVQKFCAIRCAKDGV